MSRQENSEPRFARRYDPPVNEHRQILVVRLVKHGETTKNELFSGSDYVTLPEGITYRKTPTLQITK